MRCVLMCGQNRVDSKVQVRKDSLVSEGAPDPPNNVAVCTQVLRRNILQNSPGVLCLQPSFLSSTAYSFLAQSTLTTLVCFLEKDCSI